MRILRAFFEEDSSLEKDQTLCLIWASAQRYKKRDTDGHPRPQFVVFQDVSRLVFVVRASEKYGRHDGGIDGGREHRQLQGRHALQPAVQRRFQQCVPFVNECCDRELIVLALLQLWRRKTDTVPS
jgi:hypothetical protein